MANPSWSLCRILGSTKGTLFGLKTNGRIEYSDEFSHMFNGFYDHVQESRSEEEKLIQVLENPLIGFNL
jgi:hypothetical protein